MNLVCSKLIDSGIKSVNDIVIITPAAKLNELTIILLVFFVFINIKKVPIKVDNPAIEVNINAYNVFM